ncbi:lipid-A-disaccharide synthase [Rhodovulum sp. 12E13]|nr:lipid-A-disaccharide synthase [Rhodovulum sp. 12E13]RDC73483.1 lipid-A-disaccharide synthase [Rhodovulum sp. 12E13]
MRAFLIAGEPSGDRLGAALMAGLAELAPGTAFSGVGGPEMAGQGLRSLFPMEELSVMGLAEVLPKYVALKRRIAQTAEAVVDAAPDVLIGIDSPDFCLRVARAVRAQRPGQRIVHYVAPSVWAWRPRRAEKMADRVDQVLALLPFEPPLMEAAGVRCDFVGHPVAAEPVATAAEIAAFRSAHALGDAPILAVLPGSRRGEIARLVSRFGAALARVARPDLKVIVPTLPHLESRLRQEVAGWPGAPVVLVPDAAARRAAFAAADAALAASGTVSLELAAADTPMAIAYDMAPLTRAIVSRMLRIDTVTLVNLVSETRVVPECLGRDCTPDCIARALASVLAEPAPQRAAMALTMERLGRGGAPPGLRAARAVLDGLEQGAPPA